MVGGYAGGGNVALGLPIRLNPSDVAANGQSPVSIGRLSARIVSRIRMVPPSLSIGRPWNGLENELFPAMVLLWTMAVPGGTGSAELGRRQE